MNWFYLRVTILILFVLFSISFSVALYVEKRIEKHRETRKISVKTLESRGYSVKVMKVYRLPPRILVEFKDGYRKVISGENCDLAIEGESWRVMVGMSGEIVIHELIKKNE